MLDQLRIYYEEEILKKTKYLRLYEFYELKLTQQKICRNIW